MSEEASFVTQVMGAPTLGVEEVVRIGQILDIV